MIDDRWWVITLPAAGGDCQPDLADANAKACGLVKGFGTGMRLTR
jgi:hypothetical protein